MLLPSPGNVRGFLKCLDVLLLAGDVEGNPGPENAILKEIVSGQKEISKNIYDIQIKQRRMDLNFLKCVTASCLWRTGLMECTK